jgi:hypothetical protein
VRGKGTGGAAGYTCRLELASLCATEDPEGEVLSLLILRMVPRRCTLSRRMWRLHAVARHAVASGRGSAVWPYASWGWTACKWSSTAWSRANVQADHRGVGGKILLGIRQSRIQASTRMCSWINLDPMPFLAYLKFEGSTKFASFWSAISVGLSHGASSTSTTLVGVTTTCM